MRQHSAIYEGWVRHRRFRPARHLFGYRLFMMYLDLDELPGLFDRRWLWSARRLNLACFRRADHLGDPRLPLDECVRQLVGDRSGRRPQGPIRLLTHLRYWGYGFNPVSFYFCFDRSDRDLETVVGEVNNTPWGEQHCYVLHRAMDSGPAPRKCYRFPKAFHVSPFMGMKQDYTWHFTAPGDRLRVHMDNREDGDRLFDATLLLRRREIGARSLARVLVQYPLMTAKVITAIHWQALRLWLKRCPVYPHPPVSPGRK